MRACLVAVVVLAAAGCAPAQHAATVTPPKPPSKAYLAAVRYANCMRARGLPFPMPDVAGNFHLSYRRERALKKAATQRERRAADAACFHLLRGTVSTRPLSKKAQQEALAPLYALKACLAARGYDVGKPIVRLLDRGRAMFGFDRATRVPPDIQHGCEREVKLAAKLDAIIARDRSPHRG